MALPMTTDPTAEGSNFDRRNVSPTTIAPSAVAAVSFSAPLNAPMAVRTGLQMTISCSAKVAMGGLLAHRGKRLIACSGRLSAHARTKFVGAMEVDRRIGREAAMHHPADFVRQHLAFAAFERVERRAHNVRGRALGRINATGKICVDEAGVQPHDLN